jgi:WD40 repeat protein
LARSESGSDTEEVEVQVGVIPSCAFFHAADDLRRKFMIQRRQFLGSFAAACVATGATSNFARAFTPPVTGRRLTDLSWAGEVIQTNPHNGAKLPPVVTDVSLQRTGDLLAIVGDDHYVCLYDIRQRQFIQDLDRHTDWVRSTVFSADGSRLATAGNDRQVCIWNVNDWQAPLWTKRQPKAVFDVAFNGAGLQLATVGFDRWLRVFDVSTGEEMTKLECPCPDMHAVAYASNDQWIAAGGRCGTIRVWETSTMTQAADLSAHRKRIRSIEFTPDHLILSAGDDQLVQISDPQRAQQVRSLPRHASKLYATAFLEDDLIATAGSDNQVHIWQLSDLRKLGSLRGHTGTITSLDFTGHRLVSGSYDTHVRLWSTEQHTAATQQRHTGLGHGWNQKLK